MIHAGLVPPKLARVACFGFLLDRKKSRDAEAFRTGDFGGDFRDPTTKAGKAASGAVADQVVNRHRHGALQLFFSHDQRSPSFLRMGSTIPEVLLEPFA